MTPISQPRDIEPCKICSAPAPVYGSVDLHKNCEAKRGLKLPPSGIPVAYHKCSHCGFLFTTAFDDWKREDYAEAIYNEDYIQVDPDYRELRPATNAAVLTKLFAAHKSSLSVLDYGGGNGVLARALISNGFQAATTYDPFNAEFVGLPYQQFPVVSCFETLEHVPDPYQQIAAIAKCVREDGVIIFSTLVQPAYLDDIGLAWWYIAPRNGHISVFSRQALKEAWAKYGFTVGSFSDDLQRTYATLPAFARHLVRP